MKKVAVETIRKLAKEKGMGDTFEESFGDIDVVFNVYVPIETKREIAEAVVKSCFVFDEDNRLYRHDSSIEEVMITYFLTKYYTNINLMSDPLDMYDNLKFTRLLEFIIENISADEYNEILGLIEHRVAEELRMEELKYSAGKQIAEGIELLNDRFKEGLEALENFNVEDIKTLTNILPKEERDKLSSKLSVVEEGDEEMVDISKDADSDTDG